MKKKEILLRIIPASLIGILIIVFAVINKQPFYKTLPTLVTLAVQILMVSTNRYAFLIGSINACIYGVAYIIDGVYFSAISSILMSCPVQIVTFFMWKKHRTSNKDMGTRFRTLSAKAWILNIFGMVAGFAFCYFCLAPLFKDATSPALDALCFVIGIFVSVWSAMRFVEAQYLSIISCVLSVILFTFVTIKEPSSFNFVIISVYNLYMVTMAAVNWTKAYMKQKKHAGGTR